MTTITFLSLSAFTNALRQTPLSAEALRQDGCDILAGSGFSLGQGSQRYPLPSPRWRFVDGTTLKTAPRLLAVAPQQTPASSGVHIVQLPRVADPQRPSGQVGDKPVAEEFLALLKRAVPRTDHVRPLDKREAETLLSDLFVLHKNAGPLRFFEALLESFMWGELEMSIYRHAAKVVRERFLPLFHESYVEQRLMISAVVLKKAAAKRNYLHPEAALARLERLLRFSGEEKNTLLEKTLLPLVFEADFDWEMFQRIESMSGSAAGIYLKALDIAWRRLDAETIARLERFGNANQLLGKEGSVQPLYENALDIFFAQAVEKGQKGLENTLFPRPYSVAVFLDQNPAWKNRRERFRKAIQNGIAMENETLPRWATFLNFLWQETERGKLGAGEMSAYRAIVWEAWEKRLNRELPSLAFELAFGELVAAAAVADDKFSPPPTDGFQENLTKKIIESASQIMAYFLSQPFDDAGEAWQQLCRNVLLLRVEPPRSTVFSAARRWLDALFSFSADELRKAFPRLVERILRVFGPGNEDQALSQTADRVAKILSDHLFAGQADRFRRLFLEKMEQAEILLFIRQNRRNPFSFPWLDENNAIRELPRYFEPDYAATTLELARHLDMQYIFVRQLMPWLESLLIQAEPEDREQCLRALHDHVSDPDAEIFIESYAERLNVNLA